ncbi:cytochrome c3 family protein [Ferrovibrio sp.]|uniref:cytochrome c3 family protein n=1 Tax=Ferrovibrio sp. TaxID=1917215 RepID=UPI0035AE1A71
MKLLLVEVTQRTKGGETRREKLIESASVRVGRSANCEIHIADPRVLLHAFTIEDRLGGPTLVSEAEGGVLVNGSFKSVHPITPGDRIDVGPYRMQARLKGDEYDLSFKLRQVEAATDDLAELKARSRTDLGSVGLGKRGWSWLLFAAVFAIFVALPVVGGFFKPDRKDAGMMNLASHWPGNADKVWLSGEISNPHKFFGATCESCHQQPFIQVRDDACLTCHTNVQMHAKPADSAHVGLDGYSCQNCHKEHTGPQPVVLRDEKFCASCHTDLSKRLAGTPLLDVRDFDRQHPEFKPSIPADFMSGGGWTRVALNTAPPPQEVSGLKFPHDKHLKADLRHPEKGNVKLECASCHKPDSGGVGMLPISFEGQCRDCHSLRFEALAPEREMPHGSVREAKRMVADFYAARALRGEPREAEPSTDPQRRRPGQVLTEAEKLEARAWADRKADEILNGKLGKGLCGECHMLVEANGGFEVAKPQLADRFMPLARFPHKDHREVPCLECHKADVSAAAADLLMPGINTCRSCHGGEKSTNKIASTCVACHVFHREGLPSMRKEKPADHAEFLPRLQQASMTAMVADGKAGEAAR